LVSAPALDDVVRELSPGLGSYLERMVGDSAVAEDLLQETLIKICRGLGKFEGRSSLKTWAYTIATRTAYDYFRRSDRHRHMVDMDDAEEPRDKDADVSKSFIIDEMNACVREVIDSLPEDYSAALVLHDLEGLTAQETADVCGTSLATAKVRIHRGRKRLEKAMESACDFYTDDEVLRCDRKNPG
jgi:RNA polymerase sigma-70 factor (ECF subfamily)